MIFNLNWPPQIDPLGDKNFQFAKPFKKSNNWLFNSIPKYLCRIKAVARNHVPKSCTFSAYIIKMFTCTGPFRAYTTGSSGYGKMSPVKSCIGHIFLYNALCFPALLVQPRRMKSQFITITAVLIQYPP